MADIRARRELKGALMLAANLRLDRRQGKRD
jgi:hypothetical protein